MRRRVAVLMIVGTGWLGASSADAQQPASAPTLAAVGEGHVLRAPDQAQLSVSVIKVRRTSAAARAAANAQVRRVQRVLRARGVPARDVQTEAVGVSRERIHPRGRPARTRYRAFSELDVTTRDIPRLGALFDALASTGADVTGPDFSFSDPAAAQILATRRALAQARRRADDAAAQLGTRVTGIASVDLSPLAVGYDTSSGSSGSGASAGGTRLSPGREDISAIVRVVYTLAP